MSRLGAWLFRLSFQLQWVDYALLIPLCASLPRALGLALSNIRGRFNLALKRDWIELSVGFPYIAERARAGYAEMFPRASASELDRLVLGRYLTIAREETEAQQAIIGRLDPHGLQSALVASALAQRSPGRGLVVVVPHIDNLFLTCVALATHMPALHLVTSSVVDAPAIHVALRRFYRKKYAAYEGLMNGGQFRHTSGAAKEFFYNALARGEAVAILTDAPAPRESIGCWVPWFGRMRKVPDGALKMATETGSQMVGVSSTWADCGGLNWSCTSVLDPGAIFSCEDGAQAITVYREIFGFLEGCVRANPAGWWAAHLMGDFMTKD